GDAYAALGQWDMALRDYAKAVELDPLASSGLADQLRASGKKQEAEKLIRQALEHLQKLVAGNPSVAKHHRELGRLYSITGQTEKAVIEYTRAIELKPDDWESWFRRGHAYLTHQMMDKALADFSKAIELNPQRANPWLLADVWHHWAQIHVHMGQLDKGLS